MIFSEERRASVHRFADAILKCAESGTLQNIVFSGTLDSDLLKIKGVLRLLRGKRILQLESFYTEGRVSQQNIDFEEIEKIVEKYFGEIFRRVDLNDKNGSASLMISKKGKVTATVPTALTNALHGETVNALQGGMNLFSGNDREKKHLFTGNEPFLIELGISNEQGRVHDKRQAKFRQICRFSEIVMEQAEHLPKNRTIEIADLCCGKSYLSFAVYHCLKNIAGYDVHMVCMDLKKSVMDFCEKTARKLRFDGMRFICGDIADYTPNRSPDMVISLHACDTATDIVLEFAMKWRASVILSTPCCHRQLSVELSCPTLSFIADSPILRRKFCDAATDALRLSRLACMGYTATALEFIDPESTPKNVMLRAVLKHKFSPDAPSIRKKREEYRQAYRFLTQTDPPPFPEITIVAGESNA